ncbi:hypothetical protein [Lacimonas salitolerans]|uniref:Uncharacterized protein n=1 Tax=Lacimonas salitolerans TaxID=1323750 RepID=A0ABW4EHK4_9RHOB
MAQTQTGSLNPSAADTAPAPDAPAISMPVFLQERPPQSERVQIKEGNGIWEVRIDGTFRGDYVQKSHALEAAALLKRSL